MAATWSAMARATATMGKPSSPSAEVFACSQCCPEKRPLPDRFTCDRGPVPVDDNDPKGQNAVTTTPPSTLDAVRAGRDVTR